MPGKRGFPLDDGCGSCHRACRRKDAGAGLPGGSDIKKMADPEDNRRPVAAPGVRESNADLRRKTRVLVFPCGAENAAEIHQALRYSIHVELYGASSVDDHGRFRYQNYVGGLPNISSPDFDARFAALIAELGIEVVFATHDTVLDYLAPRAPGMGFFLVNGDPDAAAVARRKSSTYALFGDCEWVPSVYADVAAVADWPVVVKPDLGQGGQGVTIATSPAAAEAALAAVRDPLLVEYLPGEEITVDCFTDRRGRLLWVGPRSRERVRAGITMRSTLLDPDPVVQKIAGDVNARLKLRGPWFFQLKRGAAEQWKLLEICCRPAGTMAAQRARGINLPLMAVQDYLGRDLLVLPEPRVRLIDRNIATRAELDYDFDTVFVDLDDTLIIDGKVTPLVAQFLYQMRNEGKQIVLITRHEYDCAATLGGACLSAALFSRIVHITDGSPKSDYITGNAIFIDNHFPERLRVSRDLGIPVFDVDSLEFFVR